jgi:hypothetical protein
LKGDCEGCYENSEEDSISTILSGVDSELFHSCEQGCAIDTHSRSSSVRAPNPSITFRERSYDFIALLPGTFVRKIFWAA